MARGRLSRNLVKQGSSGASDEEEGGAAPAVVGRRAPSGRVYAGGGPYPEHFDKIQDPKLLRDRLYDRMCDWDFHGVEEFDAWMPEREWVRAMSDLVYCGFAFDREGKKYRLRRSLLGEPAQSIVDLLSGATLLDRFEAPDVEGAGVFGGDDLGPGDEQSFSPAEDQEVDVPVAERMVLDDEGDFVLSALDYATDTAGILARKGVGKTYLATVIVEEFLASTFEIPFVVVDPTGGWHGLLAKEDGTPADHRIVLVGGERGHYPLGAAHGRQLARTVVAARPTSAILDLSLLLPEEQHLVVADFAEELYHCNREAMHVFFDEVDLFAPQRLNKASKHQRRCLTALDNLTRRGRPRGIGNTLISQRPAVVNKNLLSQVGCMFFLQMMAPQDLDAVETWLHDNIRGEAKQACRAALPVLGKGVAYFLRGGDSPVFRKFKVRKKLTFDSSSTPRLGGEPVVPVLSVLRDEDREIFDEYYVKSARAKEAEVAASTSDGGGGVVEESSFYRGDSSESGGCEDDYDPQALGLEGGGEDDDEDGVP